jgi:hypothetical protein
MCPEKGVVPHSRARMGQLRRRMARQQQRCGSVWLSNIWLKWRQLWVAKMMMRSLMMKILIAEKTQWVRYWKENA